MESQDAHLPSNGEEDLLQRGQAELHVGDAELMAAGFELSQEPWKLRREGLRQQELQVRPRLVGRFHSERRPARPSGSISMGPTSYADTCLGFAAPHGNEQALPGLPNLTTGPPAADVNRPHDMLLDARTAAVTSILTPRTHLKKSFTAVLREAAPCMAGGCSLERPVACVGTLESAAVLTATCNTERHGQCCGVV